MRYRQWRVAVFLKAAAFTKVPPGGQARLDSLTQPAAQHYFRALPVHLIRFQWPLHQRLSAYFLKLFDTAELQSRDLLRNKNRGETRNKSSETRAATSPAAG
jgi:hypothetical protein